MEIQRSFTGLSDDRQGKQGSIKNQSRIKQELNRNQTGIKQESNRNQTGIKELAISINTIMTVIRCGCTRVMVIPTFEELGFHNQNLCNSKEHERLVGSAGMTVWHCKRTRGRHLQQTA